MQLGSVSSWKDCLSLGFDVLVNIFVSALKIVHYMTVICRLVFIQGWLWEEYLYVAMAPCKILFIRYLNCPLEETICPHSLCIYWANCILISDKALVLFSQLACFTGIFMLSFYRYFLLTLKGMYLFLFIITGMIALILHLKCVLFGLSNK